MKTFWTKKNIAIVLAVLLVAAVVVLCIALRQKSVEDTEPTLTLTCQSADADGACTVDVVLSGLPDGAHYEAASLAVAFDPTQITFLGTADGDIPLVMGSLPEWESDSERANETGSARALCLPEAGGTLATSTGSVLVRLRFQLAAGVAEAALTVSDAVLAAADETESLATTTAALTVVNATVQRG
jgi:hypothetical protein